MNLLVAAALAVAATAAFCRTVNALDAEAPEAAKQYSSSTASRASSATVPVSECAAVGSDPEVGV